MNKLSLTAARGSCQILLNETYINQARALGYTEAEWKLLTGSKPWSGNERPIIKRLLDQLLHAMIDTMGLPKMQIPAEMASMCVVLFAKPQNWFQACSWMGNFHRAEELGALGGANNMTTEGLERVTAHQLFALCLLLCNDEYVQKVARSFSDKCNINLALEVPNEEQSKPKKNNSSS